MHFRLLRTIMDTSCDGQSCGEVEVEDVGIRYTDAVSLELSGNMILWLIVNVLLMGFIIGGNVLTICAVRICRRLRSVVSNLFILSLAVSDVIVGLVMPYHMAFYLQSNLGKSYTFCLLRFYVMIFACCISIWNLISIAVDRYIAIVYPLHYRRLMTRRIVLVTIALGWIVGTFVACIPVFWNHWQTANTCEFDQVLPAWYMAGIVTPGFIIIWTCMLLVYWRIWQEACKQVKQLRKATHCQLKDAPSDWKSVQVVLLIMGGFTVCWLPYFIVACGQIFFSYDTSPALYKSVLALAMANSGLNPIIYAWKNTNFRRSFALLLRCKSPNCVNNSEYSGREHCPRPVPQQGSTDIHCDEPIATINPVCIAGPTEEPVVTILNCSEPIASITIQPDARAHVVSELNAVQLFYSMETNRNRLPVVIKTTKDSCIPPRVICSPCEICKFLLGNRKKLSGPLQATLVPWKCGDYNHHIINTMKCRW